MKYKCPECGAIFDEDEIAHWQEERGEFWGFPAYEKLCGCPRCYGGGIEEYYGEEDEDEEDDG